MGFSHVARFSRPFRRDYSGVMAALPLRRTLCLLAAITIGAGASGCSSGPKNFENENDRLRREALELERAIEDLTARNRELEALLREQTRERPAADSGRDDVLAALPRCATVEIDRLSGLADTDGDGLYDAADVYVRPLDGRRRFTQVAGWLAVDLTLLPRAGASAAGGPEAVGAARLAPLELREQYRYSFMGIHYAVRVPLERPIPPGAGTLAISIALEDGVTGVTHAATFTRDVGSPPSR